MVVARVGVVTDWGVMTIGPKVVVDGNCSGKSGFLMAGGTIFMLSNSCRANDTMLVIDKFKRDGRTTIDLIKSRKGNLS